MGNIDLEFQPSVPVFDANIALGRRHDRRVVIDSTEGLIDAMDKTGVERALVYSPHAEDFDIVEGNSILMEMIDGESRLLPQFVANPATGDLDKFADEVSRLGVRSVRMAPVKHLYPFRDWIVGPWLEWMESEGIPLSIPVEQVDVSELHDTAESHPALNVILSEVHYIHAPWAIPMLRKIENTYIETSRFVIADGISRLMSSAGEQRVLFGSRFPDSSMGHQLYNLHHNSLNEPTLAAICAGNLDRLLGLES